MDVRSAEEFSQMIILACLFGQQEYERRGVVYK